jgi:hypothetical protein
MLLFLKTPQSFFQLFPTHLGNLAKFSHEYTKFHNCSLSNKDIEVGSSYWPCQTIKKQALIPLVGRKIAVLGVYGQQNNKQN